MASSHTGVSLALAALLFLGAAQPASAGDEGWREDRERVMQSNKYKRACGRSQKRFGSIQSERALAGEEPKLICRIPPAYEEKCMADGAARKEVHLLFDVTPEGLVENVRLISTDDECVVAAAVASLVMWSFEKTETGGTDMKTMITFALG